MSKLIINCLNQVTLENETYPEVTEIKCYDLRVINHKIFKKFPNLTHINVGYNYLRDGNFLKSCINLTKIDIHKNILLNIQFVKYCVNLRELCCEDNLITNLNGLQYCKELIRLSCSDNKIKKIGVLKNCTKLQSLSICMNPISDLSPISDLVNIVELGFFENEIQNIDCLKNLTQLPEIFMNSNRIKDISSLQYLTNLTTINCEDNLISDISSLRYCTLLEALFCEHNQISDLSPLQNSSFLKCLYCDNNQITSLEPLVYLRRLNELECNNNPLNPPSIQVTRFLGRIEANRRNYDTANARTIYSDTQNVHDVKVQQSVMDSVRNLMKDGLFNKITLDIDSVLTSELKASTKSRLLEYFEHTEPHVILLITYKELFTYVWNRIMNNPNRLELLKILDDNIQDSECKCFTGRFNRTLSTLVGFYDDIEINISDNSRISAIILQIKDTMIPYDSDKHKELALKQLLEAGYDSETVNLWTSVIE